MVRLIGVGILVATTTACGGGGGGDPVAASEIPQYQVDTFKASDDFKNSCASPRSGINPATDAAYPDRQGLVQHENFWLRSWSDETYLWYDEIEDQNPLDFDAPTVYFQELKTNRTTASGKPVDEFHFTLDSQEWYELITLGETVGYGASLVQTRSSVPREIRVAFVEPNSPAEAAGWSRGDRILVADGVEVEFAAGSADVGVLNAALFPDSGNSSHEFVLQKNDGSQIESTLTPALVTIQPVLTSRVLSVGNDQVGYMAFTDHSATAERQLYSVMAQFADIGVDDLILDLRYNGGGYLVVAAQLAYMIAGDTTTGQIFEQSEFNDKLGNVNPNTGEVDQPTPFVNQTVGLSLVAENPLPTLNLDRVFILTGEGTCSASEAIINGFRGIDFDVVMIGTATCGKPYGFFATDNCGTSYFTVQLRATNAKGFGDYADGFVPSNTIRNIGIPVTGCVVADDFEHELGDVNEARLQTALNYRSTGRCDDATASQKAFSSAVAEEPRLLRSPAKEIFVY